VTTVGCNYQRDFPISSTVTLLGSAGAGRAWSHFTSTIDCIQTFHCMFINTVVSTDQNIQSWNLTGGAGLKIALWKGVGVRTDFKYWWVQGGDTASNPYFITKTEK